MLLRVIVPPCIVPTCDVPCACDVPCIAPTSPPRTSAPPPANSFIPSLFNLYPHYPPTVFLIISNKIVCIPLIKMLRKILRVENTMACFFERWFREDILTFLNSPVCLGKTFWYKQRIFFDNNNKGSNRYTDDLLFLWYLLSSLTNVRKQISVFLQQNHIHV